MTGQVNVAGYRHLLEPPERGQCQDPECETVSDPAACDDCERTHPWRDHAGRNVLLVAMYADGDQSSWSRVCAACDERILRRWLAEQ